MFKLLSWLNKEKIWDFKGGIHPPEMKYQSSHIPLRRLPLSDLFVLPLQQHVGPEGELLVKVGQNVAKGQPLTRGFGKTVPIHAPTSGCITAIGPQVTAHPSGLKERCITLTADGRDSWGERHPVTDYKNETPKQLIRLIHEAGIAGLGGAGFPSAEKIHASVDKVETLIINAAECEPYITADDRLMQEYAQEIILGCEILQHILTPKRILIGIEDNKPEAISALQQALQYHDGIIQLRVIPTKYPSGGAKQLTKILTGIEVPHGQRSSAIGVLMQNVGTVYAIKRAIIDGEPLIERVVTLTGELMQKPGNVWARLGTPIKFLLQQGGFLMQDKIPMVIMGGPLMGFTLNSLDAPVVKITNCLITPSSSEFSQDEGELACIRCGQCTDVCPAGLLPQQLYWFSRGQEHEKARKHNLFDCIECGACAYVCPSSIPLVQYYRQEKAEIRAIDSETRRVNEAKARFEARTERLAREKQAREERHNRSKATLTSDERSTVAAALERVKSRREQQENNDLATAEHAEETQDTRKAALVAAIARAKAKQNTQSTEVNTPAKVDNNPADDPRKAAVAAAIARAKAKQAAAKEKLPITEPVATLSIENNESIQQQARKDAILATIAKVKAKQNASTPRDEA